jgi:glycosyltransferase involved in cell wall biosynthesis
LGFDSEKLITIPHYFDERFQSDATPINDPVRLLYVGKLASKKGVKLLPAALKRATFDFKLLIAGEGSQREVLETEFSEVGLGDQVTFLGYMGHEELSNIYEQSDIFLYPGQWPEPFGRVILEAMASSTPIISTDVGSMEWIIQDAGVVIPVEDFENKLLCGLEEIMNSYQSYIGACDERIQNFSKDSVISQFEGMYQSLG